MRGANNVGAPSLTEGVISSYASSTSINPSQLPFDKTNHTRSKTHMTKRYLDNYRQWVLRYNKVISYIEPEKMFTDVYQSPTVWDKVSHTVYYLSDKLSVILRYHADKSTYIIKS